MLIIHGDTHIHRVDRPFSDRFGRIYENLTRLETFGSPDISWVRVVLDSGTGRIVEIEPRLIS